jgi:uncharacterized protein
VLKLVSGSITPTVWVSRGTTRLRRVGGVRRPTDAQFNLGQLYRNGQGVPQDHAAAASWYRKAAEQGDANAQVNLGVMHDKGEGVPQDYVLAHLWFNLAAASGGNEAVAKARDMVASKMTPRRSRKPRS